LTSTKTTIDKMIQIKFSHWFWITTLTGLLLVHSNNAIKTEENLDQVRVGHSIASYPRKHEEAKKPWIDSSSSSISTSTSKSVSVSHVRYQVGQNQHHQPSRNIKKIIKKKVQSRKSFLEKIYAKIKEFARITLATRRANSDEENNFVKNTFEQNNSENNSHNIAASQPETREKQGESIDKPEDSDAEPDTINDDDRKWNEAGHESPNVVSFNEFSDGPLIVDTHDVSENVVDNAHQAPTDIEMSNNVRMIVDNSGDQGSKSLGSVIDKSPRSLDARGRSLWPINIPRRAKVIESVNDDGDSGRERKGLEATFSSFTQDRAVMFDSESGDSHLVEWTNIIILGVTSSCAFAFISVLVVALVVLRAKMKDPGNNCDQFSDIMSTSSRSTASTISSTRSCKSIPDKVDIISFNAEGNLRKSAYKCDDLYSLDSDYFLSSLEDISVQL